MNRPIKRKKPNPKAKGPARDPDSLESPVAELKESISELNRTSADFLKTDAETALTFSEIAQQTDDEAKMRRNRGNARKGYDTIIRLSARIPLSAEDEQFLTEKLSRLKRELQRLGEVF